MIDASIIAVPKQRNNRDENDLIKAGKTPVGKAGEEAWQKLLRLQESYQRRC